MELTLIKETSATHLVLNKLENTAYKSQTQLYQYKWMFGTITITTELNLRYINLTIVASSLGYESQRYRSIEDAKNALVKHFKNIERDLGDTKWKDKENK